MLRRTGLVVCVVASLLLAGYWTTRALHQGDTTAPTALRHPAVAPASSAHLPTPMVQPGAIKTGASSPPSTAPNLQPVSAPQVQRGGTYWLRGIVTTPDRRPVERFTLTLVPSEMAMGPPSFSRAFETPNGGFELQWKEAGPFDITAAAAGFSEGMVPSVSLASSRDEAVPWEIVLVPAARIQGQVVDDKANPIFGARVELGIYVEEVVATDAVGGAGAPEDPAAAQALLDETGLNPRQTTDPEGRFELAGLPQGIYPLSASHPGYFSAEQEVAIRPGQTLKDIRLVLSSHRGTLVVRVVDSQRAPVAGRAVSLDVTPLHGVTDQQGAWRVADVPPGLYRVVLDGGPSGASPMQWTDVPVTPGKEATVTFRVFPGTLLLGEVTRTGQPVAGADVRIDQRGGPTPASAEAGGASYATASTKTDAQGRFELTGLPPGEYQLSVGEEDDTAKIIFSLAEADRRRSFRISLGDSRVEGAIRDGRTGVPIVGALVSLFPLHMAGDDRDDDDVFVAERAQREVPSDRAGRYRMDGLAPGQYALDVSAQGYGNIMAERVEVSGAVFRHDVTLWPRGQLILTVTDNKRLPLHQVPVRIASRDDLEGGFVIGTNHFGIAHFENLAPGTYELFIGSAQPSAQALRQVVDIASGGVVRLNVTVDASATETTPPAQPAP